MLSLVSRLGIKIYLFILSIFSQISVELQLKEKEKQIVKDKFKSFNNEFEDLVKLHRAWAVPDSRIRAEIRDALQKEIVPMYSSFRER